MTSPPCAKCRNRELDAYDDIMNPPGEILEYFEKLEQGPDDIRRVRAALSAPLDRVQACIDRGFLAKPKGHWVIPTLTPEGRAKLANYRRCYDCHEEILDSPHDCPRRRPRTPYRDAR
jgi:hypothetical protein